eukprot:m.12502 g.12502  ORF g.12502 m.12502 type:complete len:50 (+) comp4004_c0_seq1:71-220(+)
MYLPPPSLPLLALFSLLLLVFYVPFSSLELLSCRSMRKMLACALTTMGT